MMVSRWWFALLSLCVCLGARSLVAQECTPAPPDQFASQLDQARTKIYLVKHEEAGALLDTAEAMLPCLSGVVLRSDLGRLAFYRGVIAFNSGELERAREAFQQAVAFNPELRWDERFGQKPRDAFNIAKTDLITATKGVLVVPELKGDAVVYIDGEGKSKGPVEVVPGGHFVQLKAGDRLVFNRMARVGRGENRPLELPAEYVVRPATASTPNVTGEPSGTVEPPATPRKPFDRTRLRPVSYGFLGVAGLSLLAGAGTGIYTYSLQKDLIDTYYRIPESWPERDDLLERQRTTAWVANGSFAAAVLFGGAGATLFLLSRPRAEAEAEVSRVIPWIGPQGAGLAWSGSF